MRDVLLQQIDELKSRVPLGSEHDAVMEAQVRLEVARRDLRECELRLQQLMMESKRWESELEQRRKNPVRLQQALLQDLEGLVQGRLFRESAEGANFFTQSLADFAYARQMGEMTVEACVKVSAEPMMITIEDRKYCWIEGPTGLLFFHPQVVDADRLMAL